MNDKIAIVLISGGMDSLTVAAMAKNAGYELAFLHLNYGQNTSKKELECFKNICSFYKIANERILIVDMTFLKKIGGSSLTDENIAVSEFHGDSDIIPSSYVPFRNAHIISTAVSWAEVIGASAIYIGANYEDSPGYPDCRPEYYEAFNTLIRVGTKASNIKIETPIIHMRKSEIIKTAIKLKAPLELSWSCYAREDMACGVCDSCALRLRGFKEAGLSDPIRYAPQI